jgi:hypothetical protein
MSTKCNLKSFVYVWTIALCAVNLWADQTDYEPAFAETRLVDGFFIGVTDELGHTNTSSDLRLCFSIWTTDKIGTTNRLNVVFPANPENAYQVELFDANGVAIPKTEMGKKVGTKFLDFGPDSFVLHATGPDERHGVKAQLAGVTEKAWNPYGQMFIMFRPSDLFDIKDPGNYMLQIRFQILTFPRSDLDQKGYTNRLIRFPPLVYPLVQLASHTNLPTKPIFPRLTSHDEVIDLQ